MENALFVFLADIRDDLLSGERPITVESPYGQHQIRYGSDEYGAEFAIISFVAPFGVFAEIEDGMYGELKGFRVTLPTIRKAISA